MNKEVRQLLKQIAIQQDTFLSDDYTVRIVYEKTLNELYYKLYLEVDANVNFYSRELDE